MFVKLLKHEFRATAPLMLIANGIAFLNGLSFWLSLSLADRFPIETLFPSIPSATAEELSILSFAILLIGSVTIVTCFLSCINPILLFPFYKRRFTRRGYLTFTRPVNPSQDFWAALIVILFWNVAAFFVLYLAWALINLLIGTDLSVSWSYYTDLFVHTPSKKLDADEWLQILSVVSVFLYRTVAGMTAVVIAGNYLRRAKAMGTIALYAALRIPVLAFLFLTDLDRSTGYVSPTDFLGSFSINTLMSPITNDLYPFYSIALLALTVICCFLSIHILKKRLNLE